MQLSTNGVQPQPNPQRRFSASAKAIAGLLLLTLLLTAVGVRVALAQSAPTFSIEATKNVGEGQGTVTLTVKLLDRAGNGTLTVQYATIEGSAKEGTDFVAQSGTLIFLPEDTEKTITIEIVNDTEEESEETFTVEISNNVGSPTNWNCEVTIIDNDGPPPDIYLDAGPGSVSESFGTVTCIVNLSKMSPTVVTVDYETKSGTATEGSDFTSLKGTLTFEVGEKSKMIALTIHNDILPEDCETFTLELSNPSNAVLSSPNSAIITIEDDDSIPSVEFNPNPIWVYEGETATAFATLSNSGIESFVEFESDGSQTAAVSGTYSDIIVTGLKEGTTNILAKLAGQIIGTGIINVQKKGADGATIKIEKDGTWANEVLKIKRPSPGNTAKFKATIENAKEKELKIRFNLVGISTEPGTNMNTGTGEDFDLTFETKDQSDKNLIDGDANKKKQSIVEDKIGTLSTTAVVTAQDYGAYGKIQAAIDGTATASALIAVLTDADANNIEDAWDTAFKAPEGGKTEATDDNDLFVASNDFTNKQVGDSLSRYEEYRGFTLNGSYATTDPAIIDVFFCDVDNIGESGDFSKANLFMEVRQVKSDEYKEVTLGGKNYSILNFNRKTATIAQQGVIRVKRDNGLVGMGGTSNSTASAPLIKTAWIPAASWDCRIKTDWGLQSINSSEAVDKIAQIIPTGPSTIAWQQNGKISLDNEEMVIIHRNNTANASYSATLRAPLKADNQSVAIYEGTLTASGWAMVDGKEAISWTSTDVTLKANAELNEEVAADANSKTLKLLVAGFVEGNDKYIYVDSEIMKLVARDKKANTLTVERAQFGTTLAKHEVGTTVYQRPQLHGVKRGLASTPNNVERSAGTKIESTRGFLVSPRTAGEEHKANTAIKYIYNETQLKAQIRMVFAHECGHLCSMDHESNSIMQQLQIAGVIDNNGIYHNYHLNNLKSMKVTNK